MYEQQIKAAVSQAELDVVVEEIAAELAVELDDSASYGEFAAILADAAESDNYSDESRADYRRMAEVLRAAEARWFELGQ